MASEPGGAAGWRRCLAADGCWGEGGEAAPGVDWAREEGGPGGRVGGGTIGWVDGTTGGMVGGVAVVGEPLRVTGAVVGNVQGS